MGVVQAPVFRQRGLKIRLHPGEGFQEGGIMHGGDAVHHGVVVIQHQAGIAQAHRIYFFTSLAWTS